MNEQIELIQNYIRAVWRLRWIALIISSLVCGIGWTAVLKMPNEYEVNARIYVDSTTMLRPLLKGIALGDDINEDNAREMRRMLLVRPNLEKIARKTDMDINAEMPKDIEKMLIGLSQGIKFSGAPGTNMYVISYRNHDAKLATRVVEAVLSTFVEHSLSESRRDASTSREFIEAQIREHEARLNAAETRRKEFKRQNVGRMPSQGGDYYNRLEALRRALRDVELEYREAKDKEAAIRLQLSREMPSGDGDDGPRYAAPVSPFDERISTLEANLDSLLSRFTDEHPDVIATRGLLTDLQIKREAYFSELEKQSKESGPSQSSSLRLKNPLYQQLSFAQAQAKANVAALGTRVNEFRLRERELAQLVDTIPSIEAELKKLDRDYDVIRTNYEKLVQRLESLKIGGDAARSTNGVEFNVIDPPRVPLVPVSPNRTKLSAIVLIGGLASGVGLTILLAMLRPVIYTKDALREISDMPVLGAVSRLWTPRERFKRRMEVTTFAVGCLCLAAVFAGLMIMYRLNLDIDIAARLGRVTERFL